MHPRDIVAEYDLWQIHDPWLIEGVIDAIIADDPKKLDQARKNPKAAGFLVGGVMKATRNCANPEIANMIIERKIVGDPGYAAEYVEIMMGQKLDDLLFGVRVARCGLW